MLAGLHTESTGEIGLTAACGSCNKDVSALGDISAAGETFYQAPVQFAVVSVINGRYGYGMYQLWK